MHIFISVAEKTDVAISGRMRISVPERAGLAVSGARKPGGWKTGPRNMKDANVFGNVDPAPTNNEQDMGKLQKTL